MFKSNVTRLKKFKGAFRFELRSNAGSDSNDSMSEAKSLDSMSDADTLCPKLQRMNELRNPNRAAKRKQKKNRARNKMTLPIKIPLALEPFYGAKPVTLRRSERLKVRNS